MYEQLTLADFQTLQNEMYAIGKQANKFIVAVTGVKSNTDWFNNAYESKGQGSGIIIANSGQELLILTERKVIAGASSVYVTFVNTHRWKPLSKNTTEIRELLYSVFRWMRLIMIP